MLKKVKPPGEKQTSAELLLRQGGVEIKG